MEVLTEVYKSFQNELQKVRENIIKKETKVNTMKKKTS